MKPIPTGYAPRLPRSMRRSPLLTICLLILLGACGCDSGATDSSAPVLTAERYPAFPGGNWSRAAMPPLPLQCRVLGNDVTVVAEGQTWKIASTFYDGKRVQATVMVFAYGEYSAGQSLSGDSGAFQFDSDSVAFRPAREVSFPLHTPGKPDHIVRVAARGEFGVARTHAARREYGRYQYRVIAGERLWLLSTDDSPEAYAEQWLAYLADVLAH